MLCHSNIFALTSSYYNNAKRLCKSVIPLRKWDVYSISLAAATLLLSRTLYSQFECDEHMYVLYNDYIVSYVQMCLHIEPTLSRLIQNVPDVICYGPKEHTCNRHNMLWIPQLPDISPKLCNQRNCGDVLFLLSFCFDSAIVIRFTADHVNIILNRKTAWSFQQQLC